VNLKRIKGNLNFIGKVPKRTRATIYKQSFEDIELQIEVDEESVMNGYTETICLDCDGSGVFEIEKGHTMKCVECKTSGVLTVILH
jgi:DnaJ-class molecular chaperone